MGSFNYSPFPYYRLPAVGSSRVILGKIQESNVTSLHFIRVLIFNQLFFNISISLYVEEKFIDRKLLLFYINVILTIICLNLKLNKLTILCNMREKRKYRLMR